MIEGTNVSEGRGTDKPFEYIGAPWINGKELAKLLNEQHLPGVKFEPVEFTPVEIPNVASHPKYSDHVCGGVYVNVTNRIKFESVKTGIAVIWGIHSLFNDSLTFRERGFDRLAGTPVIREMILQGKTVNEIEETWKEELQAFMKLRKESLLYLK